MNWSGIPYGSFLGKIMRWPLRFVPPSAVMPILSGRLRGKKWIAGSSNHGCWLGSYEFQKQRLFERTVTPGSVVFDLGGHVGFYTLLASELVGPTGMVYVFEPMPKNIRYIEQHLRLNGISNASIIQAAVCDTNGAISFCESHNSSMGHLSENGTINAKAVSLDALTEKGEIPFPDFIKIDIEGAEYLALKGALNTLKANHPTIFLATHGDKAHEDCCTFLKSLGYHLQPIDDDEVFAVLP